MTPVIIGSASLYNMDCMEFLRTCPDKSFDLAIVDPPYGIHVGDNKSGMGRRKGNKKAEYDMGNWDSSPPDQLYFDEVRRVSKNQIIWGANHFIDMIPHRSPCWIVWDKLFSNDVTFAAVELAWTSFQSTAKKFSLSPLQDDRIHPTQKPVRLYEWLLSNYAEPGQKILDTHLGSGSHAIAANRSGVSLSACEIDPGYFAKSIRRIELDYKQATLFAPERAKQIQEPLL
jgi:site-specific DNA-methyltransferase (adenine-specific)